MTFEEFLEDREQSTLRRKERTRGLVHILKMTAALLLLPALIGIAVGCGLSH